MKIGQLARITGVSSRSLRYYEQKHLIAASRHDNGYREFDLSTVERVKAIQFYFQLGLSTEQIAAFLDCVATSQAQPICSDAIRLYEDQIQQIDGHLHELLALRRRVEDHLTHLKHQPTERNEE